ncbi:hypothetical protein [Polluticaenibacter yanchengensis]|uniref:Uncharacterized protein n=1 Tax=Polluticaenibacter yanchengensis TaxID=3014562 RepID=A0ABT4UMD5_9BACT|nr:hypothetical protein [Chitinophagaceae bacterium LY-5]
MKQYIISIAMLLFATCIYAQTTTYQIDYTYKTINTNCNVFSTNTTIDNYIHQTTIGSPKFVGAPSYYIELQCKKKGVNNDLGTEYQILFPFKKGYKYKIMCYFSGSITNQNEFYPQLAMTLHKTKKAHSTLTACSGPKTSSLIYNTYFAGSNPGFGWSPSFETSALDANYESLSVGALPWNGPTITNTQTIKVQKILISEILASVANDNYTEAITLTPSSTSACTQTVSGTTLLATQSPQAAPPCTGSAGIDDDVWYKFTATGNIHSVNLSNVILDGYGGTFAAMAIYNSNLQLIECSYIDHSITSNQLVIGQTYYVRVWTGQAGANKNMSFNICVSTPGPNVIKSLTITNNSMQSDLITANFIKDASIPSSDISFVWELVHDRYNSNTLHEFSLSSSETLTNQVTLHYQATEVYVNLRVRMKRISTNSYISDWYNTSEEIAAPLNW